jgi:hypothetical protein
MLCPVTFRWKKTFMAFSPAICVFLDDELIHCGSLRQGSSVTLPVEEGAHRLKVWLHQRGAYVSARPASEFVVRPPASVVEIVYDQVWGGLKFTTAQEPDSQLPAGFSPEQLQRFERRKALLREVASLLKAGAAFAGLSGEYAYLKASEYQETGFWALFLTTPILGALYRIYHTLFPKTIRLAWSPEGITTGIVAAAPACQDDL